ncbi:hypothetical protein [Pararhizobium sp. O133]|uniref:hypothetical protein n=1 Tax=Pararhizobium sp. O133 TaxID=3449278 RepID=UPI003F682538
MQASTETVLSGKQNGIGMTLLRQPIIPFALVLACLPLALIVTLVLPIGPMYWDHYIYLDAANRIFDGQVPSVDFFAPVGGLGYYLFALWLKTFPNGHPLLLASWSLLTLTAPLMALVIADVQKRSIPLAYALLVPFLLFSILPFNTGEFYPYPGSDGFGVYNRQICQLLYVLAAGLVFVRGWNTLAAVTAFCMLGLFFIKITGIASGVVLCLMAFAAGRLTLRAAITSGLVFVAVIGLAELSCGIVSAYTNDILSLVLLNDTSLAPRLLQAASINFGVVLACAFLCLALFLTETEFFEKAKAFAARPGFAAFGRFADQSLFWLAAFILAGLLFESQNTGSQAFIFLWPLLLAIILETWERRGPSPVFAAVALLALSAALPPAVIILQKSARAWIGSANNTPLQSHNLKGLGAVSVRDLLSVRAERMRRSYIDDRSAYEAIAVSGELPSFLLYSDFEFQSLWLQSTDEAVSALKAFETDHEMRFETIMTIDFTNPFPWLMDRHAPKYIAIGADPYRAVPPVNDEMNAAVAAVDVALYPTCPPTTARLKLLDLYEPALAATHSRIKLSPCYDAFVRNELLPKP